MSGPKEIKVGKCKIIDTGGDSGVSKYATSGAKNVVNSAIGCDTDDVFADSSDEKKGFLKKLGCDLVLKAMDHPAFVKTVTFFAKWKFREYTLKKGKEDVIGYVDPDRSPTRIVSELLKCIKK